jgi:hypothetical protein
MNNENATYNAPQACDLGWADPFTGVAPCDWGSEGDYGIRCVFEWWREQFPSVDCHDLNRDGGIDLANDILGTILAYSKPAGDAGYHPDADHNRDGVIDLANDILPVILQYLDDCEAEHYPHS